VCREEVGHCPLYAVGLLQNMVVGALRHTVGISGGETSLFPASLATKVPFDWHSSVVACRFYIVYRQVF
jgi:hypothetical protein